MHFIIKSYKELTIDELYEALKLRCAVFVIEQNCNYQDKDDKDKKAHHLLGYRGKNWLHTQEYYHKAFHTKKHL